MNNRNEAGSPVTSNGAKVALLFKKEWRGKLLSCEKKQNTRQQTDRFKVGAVMDVHIKEDHPYKVSVSAEFYHGYRIGIVQLTEVYDIHPCEMSSEELEAWAKDDGFANFAEARCCFEIRYGAKWMQRWLTVIKWDGWMQRYFRVVV